MALRREEITRGDRTLPHRGAADQGRSRDAGQRTLPLLRSLPGSDAIVEMRRQTLPPLRATLTCSPPLANAFFKKKQHLKAAGCYTRQRRKDLTNPGKRTKPAGDRLGRRVFAPTLQHLLHVAKTFPDAGQRTSPHYGMEHHVHKAPD